MDDASPGLAQRLLRALPAVVLLALVVMLGIAFGYLRVVVVFVVGAGALWLGVSYFRAAGEVPPEPDTEDVSTSELRYVCTMCGLELKIEVATTDRAPSHCREKMVLVGTGQSPPPLRPI